MVIDSQRWKCVEPVPAFSVLSLDGVSAVRARRRRAAWVAHDGRGVRLRGARPPRGARGRGRAHALAAGLRVAQGRCSAPASSCRCGRSRPPAGRARRRSSSRRGRASLARWAGAVSGRAVRPRGSGARARTHPARAGGAVAAARRSDDLRDGQPAVRRVRGPPHTHNNSTTSRVVHLESRTAHGYVAYAIVEHSLWAGSRAKKLAERR